MRSLGSSTLKALRDLAAGAHWELAGARGEYAAGTGAAMRIAPLAFLLEPGSAADRVIVRHAPASVRRAKSSVRKETTGGDVRGARATHEGAAHANAMVEEQRGDRAPGLHP